MKLAEALILRKDIQTKIEQLRVRLKSNSKIQAGDEPLESPAQLLQELDGCLKQLEQLIESINLTNNQTKLPDGSNMVAALARRDVLQLRISVINDLRTSASDLIQRYGQQEIKIRSSVDVGLIQKEIDIRSKALRELETLIQSTNWSTDLI